MAHDNNTPGINDNTILFQYCETVQGTNFVKFGLKCQIGTAVESFWNGTIERYTDHMWIEPTGATRVEQQAIAVSYFLAFKTRLIELIILYADTAPIK